MYLVYVDESGSRDPQVGMQADGTCAKDWMYVLTAVAMFDMKWKSFYQPIVERKRQLLSRLRAVHGLELDLASTEIKSNWARNPAARAKREFLARLTDPDLEALVALYFEQLAECNLAIISVAFDKRHLTYPTAGFLHYKAWEFPCERVQMFMREFHPKHRAVMVADDMGKQENHALAMSHARILEHQTSARQRLDHLVELPLFVRSELSEGVQLADLCCYPIYRAMKDSNPSYQYFKYLEPYFYRSRHTYHGKVDGLKIHPQASPLRAVFEEPASKKGSPTEQARLPLEN